MKKYMILLFGFLCIGIDINSCGDKESYLTSPIYNPENNYDVIALILKASGSSGCSNNDVSVFVKEGDGYFRNAIVTINDDLLSVDEDTMMSPEYSSDSIIYDDNTEYSLKITLFDEIIASGNVTMPTTPKVTNIDSGYNHSLDKKLKVKWEPVKHATSLELLTNHYSSGLLKPTVTEYIIPDTVFQEFGEYYISIIAYNGINPNFDFGNYDTEDLEKGYNIQGATGIFVAANVWSGGDGFVIINDPAGIKSVRDRKSDYSVELEEILEKRIIEYLKKKKI